MASDGSLIFNTQIDKSGFNKGTRTISNGLGTLKSSFVKLGTTVAAVFSISKLISFSKIALNTASDLTEVQNVVDTAFGSMSNKMETFANKAVNSFGISKLTAKQTGSTFMAMARGMGLAEKNASDMSIALTGLSADMASFYNVDQEISSTALKSIFTGETETLKQFGIVMTDANLQAFALSQGITKSTSAMTQAEKVQLRYNFVMQQTQLAQGDFAKTQGSWANQTRILSERWKELAGTIGTVLINILLPAVKTINDALSSLIAFADKAVKRLSKMFGWSEDTSNSTSNISKNAQSSADNIDKSTKAQKLLTKAVNNTTKANKKNNKELKNGIANYDQLNILSQNTSSNSAKSDNTNGNLVPMNTTKYPNVGSGIGKSVGKGISDSLTNALKDLYKKCGFDTFLNNIQKGIDSVDWSDIGKNFKSIFNSLQPIAKVAFDRILDVGAAALGSVGSLIGGVISVFGKSIQTITGGIALFLKQNKDRIIGFINTISDNLVSGYNNMSHFYQNVFGLLGQSIDNIRPIMENSIANMLTGLTNFAGSIGIVLSDGFSIASQVLVDWTTNDADTFSTFFDTLQLQVSDVITTVGTVFDDLGTVISDWWDGTGSETFTNICNFFTNLGTTFMNIYNNYIKPYWDAFVDVVMSAWNSAIKPVFSKAITYISKYINYIVVMWDNYVLPAVNYIVKFVKPLIINALNAIKGVFSTVFTAIGDVIGGILDALSGLIDFMTGVFTGDWKKAWNGIKGIVKGVWNAIWGIIKGIVNLIIDGINNLWTGIYNVVSAIVNAVGGIAGAIGDVFGQDWNFSMPEKAPLIPKLATGTVVPANYGEFLAVLGDNKRETEVVSPLSTMKQAFLEAMAEGNFGGNDKDINLTINLDGEVIFKGMVNKDSDYRKRFGKSAFA
nr:hypothetical protein [uncultured Ruminococcus sp.]